MKRARIFVKFVDDSRLDVLIEIPPRSWNRFDFLRRAGLDSVTAINLQARYREAFGFRHDPTLGCRERPAFRDGLVQIAFRALYTFVRYPGWAT